jgi:hypothetical protein
LAQAAAVAKKNGFASLAEYDDASMNISMIMSGIDPHRGATPCDNAAPRHCASRRWPRRIVSQRLILLRSWPRLPRPSKAKGAQP